MMEQIMKSYKAETLPILMLDIQNDAHKLWKRIVSIAMATEGEGFLKLYVAIVVFEDFE